MEIEHSGYNSCAQRQEFIIADPNLPHGNSFLDFLCGKSCLSFRGMSYSNCEIISAITAADFCLPVKSISYIFCYSLNSFISGWQTMFPIDMMKTIYININESNVQL